MNFQDLLYELKEKYHVAIIFFAIASIPLIVYGFLKVASLYNKPLKITRFEKCLILKDMSQITNEGGKKELSSFVNYATFLVHGNICSHSSSDKDWFRLNVGTAYQVSGNYDNIGKCEIEKVGDVCQIEK